MLRFLFFQFKMKLLMTTWFHSNKLFKFRSSPYGTGRLMFSLVPNFILQALICGQLSLLSCHDVMMDPFKLINYNHLLVMLKVFFIFCLMFVLLDSFKSFPCHALYTCHNGYFRKPSFKKNRHCSHVGGWWGQPQFINLAQIH